MKLELRFSDLLTKTLYVNLPVNVSIEDFISKEVEKRLLPLTGLSNCYCLTYSSSSSDSYEVYVVTFYSKTGVALFSGFVRLYTETDKTYA